MENISKEYFGNQVLKDVSLLVKPGEIHALVGENGAGKSTLMNILFGMPVIHSTGGFSGSVKISGEPIVISSPLAAMQAGIGMVHQEFMLIPSFTITENIKIGREICNPGFVSSLLHNKYLEKLDMKKMAADSRIALDHVGMRIDEYARVAGLPIGYQQFIEIAREIDKTGIKVLVFDEPTAVLAESEAEQLMQVMRKIASDGIAIIFITHRLEEVMAVADTITVLRDGELVGIRKNAETSVNEMAEMMIGRHIESMAGKESAGRKLSFDRLALETKDFYVEMPGEDVKGIDLQVREGEVFGIGGLAGQGKIGIPNGIMGLFPAEGEVELFGKTLNFNNMGEALRNQAAFVSEDRRGVGLLLDDSIELNIVFSAMQSQNKYLKKFGPFTQANQTEIHDFAQKMMQTLDIRCTGTKQNVGSLSGGNQQKVCLAKALALNPMILFVSEPTRGIDIGAKKLVLDELLKLNREKGVTIVMVSSELVELRSICDRIAIVSDGKLVQILPPDASDVDFGLAMAGAHTKEAVND
jgi:simple sugar transport system ATP-binding protein